MNRCCALAVMLVTSLSCVVHTKSLVLAATDRTVPAGEAPISDETQACLACHSKVSPGIVQDWRASRHAHTTVETALKNPALERRVSATKVKRKSLRTVAIGCYECHRLNPDDHSDNFAHGGFKINVVVTPADCATCHPDEAEQFDRSKKAAAVENLDKNPLFHQLMDTVLSPRQVKGDVLTAMEPSQNTRQATCYQCHGTVVKVNGTRTVQTEWDEMVLPKLENWPNQGVGRVNPDGSRGTCSACHARHRFSLEVARKPHTCAQCHRSDDSPAWDVYKESKHGNIYLSDKTSWDWKAVPWRVGRDFRTPTCATCHNSLLTDPEGTVIAERTHDFGSRLWVRLFGLPYSHAQPKDGRTHTIRNPDGQPLPVTLSGKPAAEHLIDEAEQASRQTVMKRICLSCHGRNTVEGHFQRLDGVIGPTDQAVRSATEVLQRAWREGHADPSNMFNESIERHWVEQWLFYGTSVRYAAAMGSGDIATFHNGWWQLTSNLQEMHEWVSGCPRSDRRAAEK